MKSSSELSTPCPPTRYYQVLWQAGLAALPGPGDLPDYLKPERIQKSLEGGLGAQLALPATAVGPSAEPTQATVMSLEDIFYVAEELPGWHLADDNRALVRGYVLPDSEAAVAFAAFVAGVTQASGAMPSFAVVLNTVWVVLTDPVAGGITAAEVALAGRLHEVTC
ncbi:MAG: 4a-hydroxytetrahydrobiopterin dehydratase [Acidobacteriota bacterium]